MNNKTNLSAFGFSAKYYIDSKGQILDKEKNIYLSADKNNRFYLQVATGNYTRISLKALYRKVFKKEFCVDTIEDLSGEQWKPIDNTNGKYFVSNCGRIKSYCGYSAIILKTYKTAKGYLYVKINYKNVKVHKLVALQFCENKYKDTNTKTEIHHINKCRQDNRSHNLQILSIAEHHKAHIKKESINNE